MRGVIFVVRNKTKAETGNRGEKPLFNVLQIAALNAVFFVGLAVVMLLHGAVWWVAFGVAWGAAAVLTGATLVIAIALAERAALSVAVSEPAHDIDAAHGARDALDAHIRIWDADRCAELEAVQAEIMSDADAAAYADRANRAALLRQWDADAQQDAASAKHSGKRDRRKKQDKDYSGVERRAQRR